MKTLLIIFFTIINGFTFSQTIINQVVTHETYTGASNGCTDVRLLINYTYNGENFSQITPYQTINPGSSYTFSITIPINSRNLVINSKYLDFKFSGDNSTELYLIPNTNQSDLYFPSSSDRCSNPATSDLIIEGSINTAYGVKFFVSSILGK